MIQQAYKYVSPSLWSRLTFLGLKITNILKSSVCGLEKNIFVTAVGTLRWSYLARSG